MNGSIVSSFGAAPNGRTPEQIRTGTEEPKGPQDNKKPPGVWRLVV